MFYYYPPVAESNEAASVDQESIQSHGVASVGLMESAGSKTADFLLSRTEPGDFCAFVCGKGNNGGDALVAARQLHAADREIGILMIMGDQNLSEDSAANYNSLRKIASESDGIRFYKNMDELFPQPINWWVDGIFGTGLNSAVREPVATCIQEINNHPAPVLALDIPSGLDGTTGSVLRFSIKAKATIMYGMAKLGAYIEDGPYYCGERITVNLGFSGPAMQKINRFLFDEDHHPDNLKNPAFRHKYQAGIVYILAGSEGMTGAAVMAAKAAWSLGAGGVVVFTPAGLMPVFEHHLPETVKIPVGQPSDKWFMPAHAEQLDDHLSNKHPSVILCGPGSGKREETRQFFRKVLEQHAGKMVIDADAIHTLTDSTLTRPDSQNLIITPHTGEFDKLSGKSPDTFYERLNSAEQLANDLNITTLLKGQPSTVTNGKQTWITSYPTHDFSRFGFGDVLSGFLAAAYLHTTPEQACLSAMLAGIHRLRTFQKQHPNRIAQPFDLISS